MLIYAQKIICGRTTQNYSSEPHESDNIKYKRIDI